MAVDHFLCGRLNLLESLENLSTNRSRAESCKFTLDCLGLFTERVQCLLDALVLCANLDD